MASRAEHAARPGRESLSKTLGAKAAAIRARDGYACVYCKANAIGEARAGRQFHLDHLKPEAAGGTSTPKNLVVACHRCNSVRHDMSLEKWSKYAKEHLALEFDPAKISAGAARPLPGREAEQRSAGAHHAQFAEAHQAEAEAARSPAAKKAHAEAAAAHGRAAESAVDGSLTAALRLDARKATKSAHALSAPALSVVPRKREDEEQADEESGGTSFARGGRVAGGRAMGWRVHEEHPDHFIVHGNAGPFRIHKANLSSGAVEGMSRMANGGVVGEVKETPKDKEPAPPPEPAKPPPVNSSPSVFDAAKAIKEHAARLEEALNAEKMAQGGQVPSGGRARIKTDGPGPSAGSRVQALEAGGGVESGGPGDAVTPNLPDLPVAHTTADYPAEAPKPRGFDPLLAVTSPAAAVVSAIVGHNEQIAQEEAGKRGAADQREDPGQESDRPEATLATQPSVGNPLAFPKMPPVADWAGQEGEIDAAQALAKQGAEEQAAARAQKSTEMAGFYKTHLDNLKSVKDQEETELKGAQGQITQATADAAAAKIDPRHFWSDGKGGESTFKKVTAGIGMLLSGIGSGLTRQPNMAMQFIERQVDQDIEAQKAEMNQKNNAVAWAYKRYGNIKDAADVAKSYIMATLAGQAGLAGARAGSAEAQAAAKLLEAQFSQAAMGLRAGVIQGKTADQWQRYNLQWQQKLYEHFGQPGGVGGQPKGYLPSLARPPQGTDPSNPLKYSMEAQKDADERTLRGPGGAPFLTHTPHDAEKLRPMITAAEQTQGTLDAMESLRRNSSLIKGSDAADQYDRLKHSLAETWAMSNGLTQPSEVSNKNLEALIPGKWDNFVHGSKASEPIHQLLNERRNAMWLSAGLHPSALPPAFRRHETP